jgi:transcription elongation factor
VLSFVVGDVVQVVGGELKNMIGRVTAVNEMIRSVTISPFNSVLKNEVVVEADLLVKYIVAGAHVKVITLTPISSVTIIVTLTLSLSLSLSPLEIILSF